MAGHTKAFVVGVALFGVALWWLKPRDRVVTRGAEVMAVLPFTTSGPPSTTRCSGITSWAGPWSGTVIRSRARESYGRFLGLLEGADEGLLVEDEIARAREASARLLG